jgi:replication factor C subunit 3/5
MDIKNYIPLTEKYIPKTFKDFSHSQKTNKILKSFIDFKKYIPNIMLYGANGSGKYVRLLIFLKSYLKLNLKVKVRAIDTVTGLFVPIPTKKVREKNKVLFSSISNAHCEIDLNQSGIDKGLINFLKRYSRNKNVVLGIHKYVILKNFNYLKKETQNSLRFLIERSFNTVRFLITTNSLSKVIDPLRSRFVFLHVKSPTFIESKNIISNIINKENIKISNYKIKTLINNSSGKCNLINLNELILSLEGTSITNKIYKTEKQVILDNLLKLVKKGNRDDIRNYIFKLYENIPDEFNNLITVDFFKKIYDFIKDKEEFIYITQKWNHEINKNYILNPIFHAEAYLFSICELILI